MKNNIQKKGWLRQSLGFRISFSYSLFLLRSLLCQIVLLSIIFWGCALWNAAAVAREAAHLYAPIPRQTDSPALHTTIGDTADETVANDGLLIVKGARAEWIESVQNPPLFLSASPEPLTMTINVSLTEAQGNGKICVSYVFSHEVPLYLILISSWILFECIRIWKLMRRGERISHRALRPITEIAETARRLSASNLSERIELHGARAELKDLSIVLNDMLDRIESAYNVQKQFVSDASHELRTPIAVIQGYADMLDRWGKTDPEICDEAIAAIKSEAAGMKDLIEQLLFIARHDNRNHQHKNIYFDAAELVEEVLKETELVAADHHIRQGDIYRAIICGDRASLKQALRIFVDNAVKYTPKDGSITISCLKEDKLCRITVADTGIGISQADLSRIFERFYRSDSARSQHSDGHGLGLSIARMIVRAHGGHIEVQSKEDQGSRFHILLPL